MNSVTSSTTVVAWKYDLCNRAWTRRCPALLLILASKNQTSTLIRYHRSVFTCLDCSDFAMFPTLTHSSHNSLVVMWAKHAVSKDMSTQGYCRSLRYSVCSEHKIEHTFYPGVRNCLQHTQHYNSLTIFTHWSLHHIPQSWSRSSTTSRKTIAFFIPIFTTATTSSSTLLDSCR